MPNDYPYTNTFVPFDLDPLPKVTAAILIFTRSQFKSLTKITLLSGGVIFIHILLTY